MSDAEDPIKALDDAPAVPPEDDTWQPGNYSLGPASCPVCGSAGSALNMPAHLANQHGGDTDAHTWVVEHRDMLREVEPEDGTPDAASRLLAALRTASEAADRFHASDQRTAPMVPEEAKAMLDIQERLTALFFLMLRDMVPVGQLDTLVSAAINADKFDGEEVEALARRFAKRMLGDKFDVKPKHMREWIETFPERIRNSPHFEDVLGENEGQMQISEMTKQAVIGEVIRRQRADAESR